MLVELRKKSHAVEVILNGSETGISITEELIVDLQEIIGSSSDYEITKLVSYEVKMKYNDLDIIVFESLFKQELIKYLIG